MGTREYDIEVILSNMEVRPDATAKETAFKRMLARKDELFNVTSYNEALKKGKNQNIIDESMLELAAGGAAITSSPDEITGVTGAGSVKSVTGITGVSGVPGTDDVTSFTKKK